ncbi:MAG TPA: hypothetical protein VKP11_03460 [Frankiaceae bacterium]|nr:hypothetical protein [Frankiaceae bacterium]
MKHEAAAILSDVLTELKTLSYDDLVRRYLGSRGTREVLGDSGMEYQVGVEAFWDKGKPGPLRVIAVIDGDFCRTWKPLTDDFVITARGKAPWTSWRPKWWSGR